MAALPPILKPSPGMVYVTNNESGTEKTFQVYRQLPHRPGTNAIWGCGGTFILDLTSLSPEPIQYLSVFDLGAKVATFWQQIAQLIPTLDPQNLKTSQRTFLQFVNDSHGPVHYAHLLHKIQIKESFLSTQRQLVKIVTIFKEKKFAFKQFDLLNRKQFQAFLEEEQEKGAIPFAIYLSNIARCCKNSPNIIKYVKNTLYSFDLLPQDAIIIDATGGSLPTSQIHFNTPIALCDLLPLRLELIFKSAILDDDADFIKLLVKHGVDPKGHCEGQQGVTYLMFAKSKGKSKAVCALLASKADLNVFRRKNPPPPMSAASQRIVESLIALKANPDPLPQPKIKMPLFKPKVEMPLLINVASVN